MQRKKKQLSWMLFMLPFNNAIMNAMRSLSQSSVDQSCQDLQSQLALIREELNQEVLEVSEGLRHYTDLVDNYYSECLPFSNNSVDADYKDIIELIGHSMVIGSYYLLDKWVVQHPLQNPSCLSQPLEKYVQTFQEIVDNRWQNVASRYNWPPQARAYCEYLIKAWSAQLARGTVVLRGEALKSSG